MTTATGAGDFRLTDPMPRGCGNRKKGGLYACCGTSPDGKPIEHFLFCPPIAYPEKFHRAPKLADIGTGTNNGMVIWIGGEFYPYPSDFVEEAKQQGVSRRIPAAWPVDKLEQPAFMACIHAKARLMNAPSLGLGKPAYCPKDAHNEGGMPKFEGEFLPAPYDIAIPCLGRSWELAPATYTMELDGDSSAATGVRIKCPARRIGSTGYKVFPPWDELRSQPIQLVDGKEMLVRPAYEPGLFAMFPLTHFEYVKTGHEETDQKVLERKIHIPIVGVEK